MRKRSTVPNSFELPVFTGIMLCMVLACAPTVSSSRVSVGPLSGMEFITIPAGEFRMGSMPTEEDRNDDEKRHTVTVRAFEMMTTEVTQGMWREVMGSNPAHDCGVGDDYPVYFVSWDDCQLFIDELNHLYPGRNYRLPTEAEWEYACRAGTTTAYYWGSSMNGDYCWYDGNSYNSSHPVGQKLPNAWGLYDMSGNVWEWCQDRYTSDYDDCPANGSAFTVTGRYRVRRGGSWSIFARYCRSAIRYGGSPECSHDLGLRLARSAR